MSQRYLIDTNGLVYVHDGTDTAKSTRAAEVLRGVRAARSAALPAQAL
ncbi:MAG: hypothetical protein IPK82_11155 [Polyangiaceae bacterium]|nr:hypothetical protein [Polyangiaceae bacterium]